MTLCISRSMALVAIVAVVSCIPASAQWLKHPTPGIPRTPDGKPDLTAAAPRTPDGKPDVSGLWRPNPRGYHVNITADLKPNEFRPWAAALTKQRIETLSRDSPTVLCLPVGPTLRAMTPVKVIQTNRSLVMLHEIGSLTREVFMDGRPLPVDPNPSWNGYSIGHWDGETLVIESSGFNDRTWLDITGHPHSEELRITERFSRRDFGHMQLQLTIDDPKAYMRPFTIPLDLDLMPDTELLENVCAENERDAAKIARATLKTIELPSEVLSTFAGEYEITAGDAGGFIRRGAGAFVITLEDGQLMLLRPGDRARTPLVPTSKTHFVLIGSGADVEFVGDGRGRVTGFTFQVAEGDVKASRRGN